ncbi:MAG TPA: enoyl-ACP reductase [Nitrospira sp.]|jgi:enoyl-[acyl-carrier protein] reductase I|uniref:enoyl-ACP reductase FabI n=1 Tax=Nitrospira sp. ND1 TaxID=1658518 RepID=UPI0009B96ED2|nr:enoyl-ACP reductase [Nitrospira sp. ND1]MBK7419750.1 enoyl-ACP reductase [Nitrospira sp.]MBK7486646.1 enoyl-ACP reductase [Nitrospira sp.]MBK8378471.1 enoyl-ACP reductase [Nitrospira sp.]MBK9111313.1 enoyl-ACP reductase [Nitrospira sp.]MBK9999485.1 enoyl-ACP reductase [Nitrospira sp.]
MLLEGKKGLIIGVANKHSIAWAIAQAAAREGAQMLFSYQNERLRENVEELVQTLPGASACVCDVGDDSQIDAMMKQASEKLGRLDFLVHSLAFAPREELTGEFVNTTRQGFATALDVSAYSLVAVTRAAMPLMTEGGSVVTLTYLGSERVVPHYNVMGVAKAALEATVRYLAHDLGPKNIRVNAVSAGPIKTLAARGVSGISKMVDHHRAFAPLRRATEQGEVGDTALFLVSPLGRGITGEVIYVDGGYHILGSLASVD